MARRQAYRPMVVLLVGLVPALGLGLWLAVDDRPIDPFEIGLQLLENGRADDAAFMFDDPLWQAVAHYRAGRYHHAASGFGQTNSTLAIYNLGVASARQYNWQNAIAAFEETLRREPGHADARHNLALVKQAQLAEQRQREASRRTVRYGTSEHQAAEQNDEGNEADGQEGQPAAPPGVNRASTQRPENNDLTNASADHGLAGNNMLADAQAAAATDPDDIIRDADPEVQGKSGFRRGASHAPQARDFLLGQIKDDPARVLRSRLRTAWARRQAFNKP